MSLAFSVRNISMVRLSVATWRFTIQRQSDATPYNLTGCTLIFAAKRSEDDVDASAAILLKSTDAGAPFTIVDAANGIFTLTIPKTATSSLPDVHGNYLPLHYAIKIVPTGAVAPITPVRGILSIYPAVVISES